jgi:branched-subunit amino acid aminotransferase/4-amino-4-deoxychorismate lyase
MWGNAIDELVHANGVRDGRARVTFFDESPTDLWPTAGPDRTSVLISTADRREVPEYFRLTVSPFAVNSASPLAGVKSCNYLEKLLARSEARSRGFDECIQLNERAEIVSAAMANVFWLKGDALFTPSLRTGCLQGTVRMQVLDGVEAARRVRPGNAIVCTEVEAGIEELGRADEIYLTSAALGVVRVAEFEGRELRRESTFLTDMLRRI